MHGYEERFGDIRGLSEGLCDPPVSRVAQRKGKDHANRKATGNGSYGNGGHVWGHTGFQR
jgi:hypothetical protein